MFLCEFFVSSDIGSKLGLCLCHCENGWRSPTRTGCCATNSRIRADMARGEVSMLGSIVSFCHTVLLSFLGLTSRHSFRILITGASSGLVETITDAVSIHSIKKAEYARRLAEGRLGYVTLLDHFRTTYGDPSTAKFARAQRNFAKSLAGELFPRSLQLLRTAINSIKATRLLPTFFK